MPNQRTPFNAHEVRPTEYKYWMLGISILCGSGLLASIFPTFGTVMDYFWALLFGGFVLAVISYAVKEYIKEKLFWRK